MDFAYAQSEEELAERLQSVEDAIGLVRGELLNVIRKWPPFHSMHEGYAVLKEEVDEMWDAIKADDMQQAVCEAVQVAAMAIRFISETVIVEQEKEKRRRYK